MQGFYQVSSVNSTDEPLLDPTGLMSNGSYVESPLGGYQYPWVQSASSGDPMSVFVDGTSYCSAWDNAASAVENSADFQAQQKASQALYTQVGDMLGDAQLPAEEYTYLNAYK